jgi:hypothetical protein
MKLSLTTILLLAPLTLAATNSETLPDREPTNDSVSAGDAGSDVPKAADGLNAAALYCPIQFPRYCPFGFCCRYSKCCSLECCVDQATFCSYGRCYR